MCAVLNTHIGGCIETNTWSVDSTLWSGIVTVTVCQLWRQEAMTSSHHSKHRKSARTWHHPFYVFLHVYVPVFLNILTKNNRVFPTVGCYFFIFTLLWNVRLDVLWLFLWIFSPTCVRGTGDNLGAIRKSEDTSPCAARDYVCVHDEYDWLEVDNLMQLTSPHCVENCPDSPEVGAYALCWLKTRACFRWILSQYRWKTSGTCTSHNALRLTAAAVLPNNTHFTKY